MDNFLKEYDKVIASFLSISGKQPEEIARELYDEMYSEEFNEYLKYGYRPRIEEIEKISNAMYLMKRDELEGKLQYKSSNLDEKPKLYIWRTMDDEKVRGSHADKDGQTFDWNSGDLRPGEDYNCRCYAEFLEVDEKDKIWYGKETPYLKNGKYTPHFIMALTPESLRKIDEWYHEKYKEHKNSDQPMIPYYKGLPDETLHNNIREARKHQNDFIDSKIGWFKNQVDSGKEWDYKNVNYAREDFGNFNYGATGRAFGFGRGLLILAASVAHMISNRTLSGDDPRDQEMIIQGMEYYDKYYEPKYGKN